MSRLLGAVVLGGCAEAVPLSEVPIDGGTPEQRALVTEELRAFERWVGEGRVELREVRFDAYEHQSYSVAARRVKLNDDLSVTSVRRAMRHELCHALDFQSDLLNRPTDPFDPQFAKFAAVGAFESGPNVDRFRRSEIMADTCELGPAVALLLQSCPNDPEGLAPIAQFLVDEVWTGDVDLLADPVRVETVAERVGPFPPRRSPVRRQRGRRVRPGEPGRSGPGRRSVD